MIGLVLIRIMLGLIVEALVLVVVVRLEVWLLVAVLLLGVGVVRVLGVRLLPAEADFLVRLELRLLLVRVLLLAVFIWRRLFILNILRWHILEMK